MKFHMQADCYFEADDLDDAMDMIRLHFTFDNEGDCLLPDLVEHGILDVHGVADCAKSQFSITVERQ